MANYLLTLLSVLALCAFIKCFWDEGCTFAPLAVISALMLWFTFFGYADKLLLGGILWLAVGAAALAAVIFKIIKTKENRKNKIASLFSADIVIFFLLSTAFAVLLKSQNAMFLRWDEFSFWGSAAKVTVLTDRLYTYGAFSLTDRLVYPCALPLLCYAFQFIGNGFCEWAAYAAYNTLIFAAISAVSGAALTRVNKKSIATAAAFICTAAVFVFESQASAFANIYAFRSVMSEMPLGALFGGTLCIYFSKQEKNRYCFIPLVFALSALSLIKDVGFVLAFIAVFIIAADMLFCGSVCELSQKKHSRFAKALKTLLLSVALLAASAAAFFSWNIHVAAVTGQNRTAADGSAQLSMAGILINGFKELMGIGTTERFSQTLKNMASAFFKTPVSICFSGVFISLIISAVLAAAYIAADEKRLKKSTVCLALTGFTGLGGLMLFQLFAYVYVFDEASGTSLIEYGRYMSVYYFGFFISAVGLLAAALSGGKKRFSGILISALSLLMLCSFSLMPQQKNIIGMSDTVSESRVLLNERAAPLADLGKEDRVYVISQGDNGQKFFNYAFLAMPAQIQAPICTLMISPDDTELAQLPGAEQVSAERFAEYLVENNCGYVLLDDIDDHIYQDFLPLFSDGLSGFFNKGIRLYRVQTDKETVTLIPCTGENTQ